MSNNKVNYPALSPETDPLEIPDFLTRAGEVQKEDIVSSISGTDIVPHIRYLVSENSKLELRCPNHPNYQAVRKPKVNCPTCHELYGLINGKPSK